MRFFVISSLLLLTLGAVGGCGGHGSGDIDEVIGESCVNDRDCDTRCYIDGEFPGGICSLPCQSDNDCPSDTFCMKKADGVCLFACPDFDCGRLGAGWTCRDKERENGGQISVCIGD